MNTDDQAQWTIGAYGNSEVITPNMDRLAHEGMRFTQAFSKPVCSPSRAMLLTGQYSHRLGIPDYIPYGNPLYAENGLPVGTPTIASVLKGGGYTTALIGKWHVGYGEKYFPEHFGFDVAECYEYVPPGKKYAGYHQVPEVVDGQLVFGLLKNKRLTDILADRAIHFVRENRGKPFFLYLAIYEPHQTVWDAVPDEDLAHYNKRPLTVPDISPFSDAQIDQTTLRKLMATYYGAVTCADRNLGRLLAVLDELKLSDNTLIVFMSDNGMNLGHHGLIGKGNAAFLGTNRRRPNIFDHSNVVPLIVRWPGVVRPGQTNNALVSSLDILPTLMAITGAGAGQKMQLDGRSLLPLFKGERDTNWRNFYCDTYDMIYLGNHGEKPYMRMIRTDQWKLNLFLDAAGQPLDNGNRHELFDLKSDREELTNLYGRPAVATIKQQLETQLRAWMRETGVTK
ncbi:MAG: sulfatase-like hydrolase/transferase [Verrucomicrobia bacterium]|nr:sulfatase-like hydrolase/transferase [Verrucomicrobiota bacterium]